MVVSNSLENQAAKRYKQGGGLLRRTNQPLTNTIMRATLTILICLVCITLATGQTKQINPTDSTVITFYCNPQYKLYFDGIYVTKTYYSKSADSIIGLLRFYEDGTVISSIMVPMKKNWTADSISWFKKEQIQVDDKVYRPIGKYNIKGNKIWFTIKTKMTKKIKYKGTLIDSLTLEIALYSSLTKKKSIHTYYFNRFKS